MDLGLCTRLPSPSTKYASSASSPYTAFCSSAAELRGSRICVSIHCRRTTRIASRRSASGLRSRPAASASRRPDSISSSTCRSSAGVRSNSAGSRITSGKYTVVRNCCCAPNSIGTTRPSITAAAAELLVPKSIPRRMTVPGAGGAAHCGASRRATQARPQTHEARIGGPRRGRETWSLTARRRRGPGSFPARWPRARRPLPRRSAAPARPAGGCRRWSPALRRPR
ncbi:hypothetical protein NB705_002983 [Xanthomonas sacchari]|nr:hypothetical protein [Xanthomonas sacchari]